MKPTHCLLLPLLGLFAFSSLWGQGPSFSFPSEDGSIQSLDQYMASNSVKAVSLVAFWEGRKDTAIYLGACGPGGEQEVDAHTLYQMGSLSMSVVHFAVLKAATEGKLELDQPVNAQLRSWQLPGKKWMEEDPVTVRDLLLHRRQFNIPYKPEGKSQSAVLPDLGQMLRGEDPATNPPVKVTQRTNPSGNSSYATGLILQQLLEDVHGKPIAQVMADEVLGPLGMEDSWWGIAPAGDQLSRLAMGHELDGKPVEGGFGVYAEQACAGFWATPEDYSRLVRHVFDAAEGKEGLISRELAVASIRAQEGQRSLIFNDSNGLFWGGAPYGYYCMFRGSPENGAWVLVFTNSNINWRFNNEVMAKSWDYLKAK